MEAFKQIQRIVIVFFYLISWALNGWCQSSGWKTGIIKDEFVFEDAPFAQCHAPTIAETPGGLIAAWFGGSWEGNKDVCIWVSHKNNGKWSSPVKVADGILNDTLRFACYNPVLYQVKGGDLILFYKVGPFVAAWKGWMKTSSNGGYTWSEPIALPNGILGPTKNKPVLMSDGRLVCPGSRETSGWQVYFESTTDFGKVWTIYGPVNNGNEISAIQPTILNYGNGQFQALCRSKNGVILQTWSNNNCHTWSSLYPLALPNNNSGIDAVTLKDGRQMLVYNHSKSKEDYPKAPRSPLNVAVSYDGNTWFASLVLEDATGAEFSYPSVIQSSDGKVHIVYTWKRKYIKYVEIDPTKLLLKKIKDEVWPVN